MVTARSFVHEKLSLSFFLSLLRLARVLDVFLELLLLTPLLQLFLELLILPLLLLTLGLDLVLKLAKLLLAHVVVLLDLLQSKLIETIKFRNTTP
jgi:hypothetical protein